MSVPRVLIVVRGGVVQNVVSTSNDVKVFLKDFDNLAETEPAYREEAVREGVLVERVGDVKFEDYLLADLDD